MPENKPPLHHHLLACLIMCLHYSAKLLSNRYITVLIKMAKRIHCKERSLDASKSSGYKTAGLRGPVCHPQNNILQSMPCFSKALEETDGITLVTKGQADYFPLDNCQPYRIPVCTGMTEYARFRLIRKHQI